jgi:hypothetical protein
MINKNGNFVTQKRKSDPSVDSFQTIASQSRKYLSREKTKSDIDNYYPNSLIEANGDY